MTPLTADDGALTAFAAEAPGARRGALAENVLAFAALLREGGLPVTTGRAVEAVAARRGANQSMGTGGGPGGWFRARRFPPRDQSSGR